MKRLVFEPAAESFYSGICSIAAAVIGSAVVGAVGSSIASSKAASAQEKAADKSSDTQLQMFNKMQNTLQPYVDTGNTALQGLGSLTSSGYFSPITMDQATLEKTPGYQFTLGQGLKSTQNAAAARGLGVSGAALKAASNYATGLASNTYQQQFSNALANQNNVFNRLMSMAQLGESAGAGVGSAGIQTGQTIGQNTIGAGNAAAGAYMNMGNAFNNAASSVGNLYTTNALMKGMGMPGFF